MIKSYRKIYSFYIIIDFILMGIAFYVPYLLKYNTLSGLFSKNSNLVNANEYSFIFLLWTVLIFIFFKKYSLFSTDRALTIPKENIRVFISVFFSGLLINAVIFFAQFKFFSRKIFIGNCLLLLILLGLWRTVKRIILRILISKGFHNIKVLVIGSGIGALAFLEETRKMPWLGLRVVGFLDDDRTGIILEVPILGKIKDFQSIIKRKFIDEIVVCGNLKKEPFSDIIKETKKMYAGIRIIPEDFTEPLPAINTGYLGIVPIITYKESRHTQSSYFFKRLVDFIISVILLIVLAPFFLIIFLLIKLDSRGSVFYVQKRVGIKGKIFDFYKFRSMIAEADKLKEDLLEKNEVKDGVIFKMKSDPRITRIGKFIRKYSIDELPQLLNVLKGDMSLVGPRPPTPEEVKKYKDDYLERLSIKPGITGLAQIKGRSDLSFYKWMRWDSWYVNNWSLGLDLRILWLTIPAVIKGSGAY